ncbi:MAG: alpha/beta hydrolase family protein [Promethearchaeota archaeon]
MVKILKENVEIPVDSGVSLKGTIYSKISSSLSKPFIINISGIGEHRESNFVEYFSKHFAQAGFQVLSYDHRAHGETIKQTGRNIVKNLTNIFSDITKVLTWMLNDQKHRLLDNRIALFGRSLAGAIILTRGFIDRRANILISLCARYDYHTYTGLKLSEDIIHDISPKYHLKFHPDNNNRILIAHCRDDDIIPFKNLLQIKEALHLSDENTIIYDSGNHSFIGNKRDIFEKSIQFLKKI